MRRSLRASAFLALEVRGTDSTFNFLEAEGEASIRTWRFEILDIATDLSVLKYEGEVLE